MRVAILGATGSVGRHVVNLALVARHDIVASARTPARIDRAHERLRIECGDALDEGHLRTVFEGCDAVVSCLGNGSFFDQRKVTTFYSDTTRTILAAMEAVGTERFITITSTGVEHDPDAPWFYRKLIKPQLKTYDDMSRAEALVEVSDAAWTIVRPSWLRPGGATGTYRARDRRNPANGWKIAVGDVAHFMVTELDDGDWIRRHPALAH